MAITAISLSTQAIDSTLIPSKISTNPADNFVFPNNVTVSNILLTPTISDLTALVALDVTNRYLKDTSNKITLDWLNRLLYASDGTTQNINFNTPGLIEIDATLDATGHSIIHVADPVNPSDAANKIYVDTIAQGLAVKASCTAATTAALPPVTPAGQGFGKTLTANSNGLLVVDGVNIWVDVVNDGGSSDPTATLPASRVLVKDQLNQTDNGIYYIQDKGSVSTPFILERSPDFDGDGSTDNDIVPGCFTFIAEGTINISSGWVLTTPPTAHTINITSVDGDGVTLHVTTNAGSSPNGVITQGATSSTVTSVPVPYGTTIVVVSNAGFVAGSATATPPLIIIDDDNITFSQFSGAGQIIAGDGLTKSGNQLDVAPLDASLEVHIGDISVRRDPAGAIGLSGVGIAVNTDGTYIGISANNVTLLNPTQHTVAGADTQVQFNNLGTFGASAGLTWNGIALKATQLTTDVVNMASGTQVEDLLNRYLLGTTGVFTVAWGAQILAANGQWSVVWGDQNIGGTTIRRLASNDSTSALDWTNRLLGDNTGTGGNYVIGSGALNAKTSIDWANRHLVGTDGATTLLNWSSLGTVQLTSALLDMNSHKIQNVTDPTLAQDAATKNYVDGGAHTVAGSNTQLQYNNSGAFGASGDLTFDNTAHILTLTTQDNSYASTLTITSAGVASGSDSQSSLTLTGGLPTDGSFAYGANLLMTTADGTGGQIAYCGNFTMTTGSGWRSPRGGTFTLTTGDSIGNSGPIIGGSMVLTSGTKVGSGSNDNGTSGANLTLTCGDDSAGIGPFSNAVGGSITLTSGPAPAISQEYGGSIELTANHPQRGGNLFLTGTDASRGQLAVGTDSPVASASVQIDSTTRGFLLPRMTTTQRNAIASPATGLMIYNTTTVQPESYNGSTWEAADSTENVTTQSTTYTAVPAFPIILADASGAGFTITLPTAASSTNQKFTIKKIDSSVNVVTIQGNGAETIDGVNTQTLNAQWQSYVMVSNGTSWFLI